MKRFLYILLLAALFSSCAGGPDIREKIILDRLDYVVHLRSMVDRHIWNGFGDKVSDLPIIYYTDSMCYVANPTQKFLDTYNPEPVSRKKGMAVYRTGLLDSVPFHMSARVILGDSIPDYDYRSPYLNCSSVEITRRTIPGVNSTEQWATMVLHEYFHGFQYKHPAYLDHFEKNVVSVPEDSLKQMYHSLVWFKDSADRENEMLLAAIGAENEAEVKDRVDTFFRLRHTRRDFIKKTLDFDITACEQTYETMEGTARYMEYALYGLLAQEDPDSTLVKTDVSYHSHDYFHSFRTEDEPWLYYTDRTTWYYATGFNLARLLDRLGVEYKSRLFAEGGLSLEDILMEWYTNISLSDITS